MTRRHIFFLEKKRNLVKENSNYSLELHFTLKNFKEKKKELIRRKNFHFQFECLKRKQQKMNIENRQQTASTTANFDVIYFFTFF